jgi:hypothetical protein
MVTNITRPVDAFLVTSNQNKTLVHKQQASRFPASLVLACVLSFQVSRLIEYYRRYHHH